MRVLHHLILIGLAVVWGAPSPARGADLSPEQVDALVDRAAKALAETIGKGKRIPNDDAAELQYLLVHGDVTDAQWTRLLNESEFIKVCERWPPATPLQIWTGVPTWAGLRGSVKITPRIEHQTYAQIFQSNSEGNVNAFSLTARNLDVLPLGRHNVAFDVEVSMWAEPSRVHPRAGAIIAKHIVRKGTIIRPIRIFAPDALRPVDSPEMRREICDSLVFLRGVDERGVHSVKATLTPECIRLSRSCAISLDVEVLDGSDEVFQHRIVNLSTDALMEGGVVHHVMYPRSSPPMPDEALSWKIRIRGNAEAATMGSLSDAYWAGEFTLPYDEAMVVE